jgi:response regulator RpfG family c-di-GMP phosphodiesterase
LEDFPLKEKDITEQSVLIGYVCEYLLTKTGTFSEISKLKLGISALLHDCFLENDRLATIYSKTTDEYLRLNAKDKELFDQHVILARDAAKEFNAHAELDFIIVEHHELPGGTGFPRGLNAHSLNQLSCIFILARNFVSGICRTGSSKKSISEILRKLTVDFEKGNFRIPLKALNELLS